MNKLKEFLIITLSLVALLTASFVNASEVKSKVSFSKEVEVHAKMQITLYDIVEMQVGKAELLESFKNIIVIDDFASDEVALSGPEILKKNKESFKGLFLEMPSHIKVKKSSSIVSHQQVKREIMNQLKSSCADCDFALSSLVVPAIRNANIEVDYSKLPIKGAFMLPVTEITDKGMSQKWITGQVKTFKDVVMTAKMIPMNQRIEASDLKIKRTDITFVKEPDMAAEDFIGQLASRPLSPNMVIARSDLKREPLVKRGSSVKVITGTDSFEITIQGVAEEAGFHGDTIKFKNPETQKVMTGVVTEAGTVRIQ